MIGAGPRRLLRAGLAGAAIACSAGCVAPPVGPLVVEQPESSALPGGMSAQAAQDAVAVGKGTRADVAAVLGKGTVVRFDSGWEVWVYRTQEGPRSAREPTEFVVLFTPAGVVKKTRVRPGELVKRGG